jgi:hypothetical protein
MFYNFLTNIFLQLTFIYDTNIYRHYHLTIIIHSLVILFFRIKETKYRA